MLNDLKRVDMPENKTKQPTNQPNSAEVGFRKLSKILR